MSPSQIIEQQVRKFLLARDIAGLVAFIIAYGANPSTAESDAKAELITKTQEKIAEAEALTTKLQADLAELQKP